MNLLYKDLALAAHPTLFIFTLLGCLVIVPAYPYTVIFMFGCLVPYISLMFARENNDTWYTILLPVTKGEIVAAKLRLFAGAQWIQILISAPFALLRHAVGIGNNPVGIDPVISWYGFGFILFALFNLIFFPVYYKTGYKAGKAFLAAMPLIVLFMVMCEASVHIPALSWLDSSAPTDLLCQLPILICGIAFHTLSIAFTYKVCVPRFEKVDL